MGYSAAPLDQCGRRLAHRRDFSTRHIRPPLCGRGAAIRCALDGGRAGIDKQSEGGLTMTILKTMAEGLAFLFVLGGAIFLVVVL
jgi:hypothetical protein